MQTSLKEFYAKLSSAESQAEALSAHWQIRMISQSLVTDSNIKFSKHKLNYIFRAMQGDHEEHNSIIWISSSFLGFTYASFICLGENVYNFFVRIKFKSLGSQEIMNKTKAKCLE